MDKRGAYVLEESRRNSLMQVCRELVRRPSPSGQEGTVARFVADTMRSLGYDSVTTDLYGNVLGSIVFSPGPERVLLTAQMDHVDAGDAAEWSQYPYGGFIEQNRIFGRGTSDQKGALAAMILAGAFLKADREKYLRGELTVAAAVHQETFEDVAARAISDFVEPTSVIVGEASDLLLERGQRGRAEIQIEIFGKMAHSSHPEFGLNAAETMASLLAFIKKEFTPPSDPFLGKGILVLTSLYSTPLSNSGAIPEKCTAVFDRRLLGGETLEGVIGQIESIIEAACPVIPGLRAAVTFPLMESRCYTGSPIRGNHYAPAWFLPSHSPLLTVLSGALSKAGLPSAVSSRPGFGTNGCFFAGVRDIPTVIYGPSKREQVHGIDEYIEIEDLVTACRGYTAMGEALLKAGGSEKYPEENPYHLQKERK